MIRVTDIEYPLYKNWIFCRFDANNRSVDKIQLFKQRLKVWIIIAITIANLMRYVFYLYKSEHDKLLPIHYMEATQYFGGITRFTLMICIMSNNGGIFVVIL